MLALRMPIRYQPRRYLSREERNGVAIDRIYGSVAVPGALFNFRGPYSW